MKFILEIDMNEPEFFNEGRPSFFMNALQKHVQHAADLIGDGHSDYKLVSLEGSKVIGQFCVIHEEN